MTINPLAIVPEVGSSGFFTLATPFDQKIAAGVRYTCQAVRRISDYLGNNEDVKAGIYDANGISEDIWEEDKQADAYVASLQGETGQWLYVPTRYVIGYPDTNGVPYHTAALMVALPGIQTDRDLTDLYAKITDAVRGSLGTSCVIEKIETSKVTLVDSAKHDQIQTNRNIVIGTPGTNAARAAYLQIQLDAAIVYIAQLEDWIQQNSPVADVPAP